MKNNEIKEILENVFDLAISECPSRDIEKIKKVKDYITNLQQKVEQYENPDDMTLFYMWLDEKAKDKMKQLENEVMMLKQQNTMITTLGEDYKSRCEKATKYINNLDKDYDINVYQEDKHWAYVLYILNGDDKSE